MARFVWTIVVAALVVGMISFMAGCGDKNAADKEMVFGNWTHYRNRAYILLSINPKGSWQSSVRIADVTSKIVANKGDAEGTWHLQGNQLMFTVMESSIENVWEKNNTYVFDVVELTDQRMLLQEENQRVEKWEKTRAKKPGEEPENIAVVIPMAPLAVNLNKISSGAPDRYLCLNMELALKELMPGQQVPRLHPRAKEALLLFLSSLIHSDVEDFDKVKAQKSRLVEVLNPYMDGVIKDINIKRVIVSTSMERVEEFIIEHTIGAEKGAKKD
jgi:flagellar basal body-associated protein FliL